MQNLLNPNLKLTPAEMFATFLLLLASVVGIFSAYTVVFHNNNFPSQQNTDEYAYPEQNPTGQLLELKPVSSRAKETEPEDFVYQILGDPADHNVEIIAYSGYGKEKYGFDKVNNTGHCAVQDIAFPSTVTDKNGATYTIRSLNLPKYTFNGGELDISECRKMNIIAWPKYLTSLKSIGFAHRESAADLVLGKIPTEWPEGITEIPAEMFMEANNLTLPDSWANIEVIGERAFKDTVLAEQLPSSWGKVHTIGHQAFEKSRITVLPSSWGEITRINAATFRFNDIVTLPETWGKITFIDDHGFDANKIKAVPSAWDPVEFIGWRAFHNNYLSDLPDTFGSVTAVRDRSFTMNCIARENRTIGTLSIEPAGPRRDVTADGPVYFMAEDETQNCSH